MNGVTTAILLYIFAGLILPSIVRSRPQFYVGLACVLVVIVLDSFARIVPGSATAMYAIGALLQVMAVVALVLSAGGLTVKELGADMKGAYQVMRRGEEHPEVIIPPPKDLMPGERRGPTGGGGPSGGSIPLE